MNNQINGISPTNPKAIIYFQAALKYFENQVSNEFLNWTGKYKNGNMGLWIIR